MKKIKILIERIKGMPEKTKNTVLGIVATILAVVLFVSGYSFASIKLCEPTSEEEFKHYEQVAKDIYAQGTVLIYDIPADVGAEITNNKIVISSSAPYKSATLTAQLQDGELVFTRNLHKVEEVIGCVCVGVLFVIVTIATILVGSLIYDWSKKRYVSWQKKHK